jgi:cell division protein FtsL
LKELKSVLRKLNHNTNPMKTIEIIVLAITVLNAIGIAWIYFDHFKLVSNVRRPGKKRLQKSNNRFRDFNSDSDRGGMVKKLK